MSAALQVGDSVVVLAGTYGGRAGVSATIRQAKARRRRPPDPIRYDYWLEKNGETLGWYSADEIVRVAAT